jgi:serine/threonine protein kinase
VAIKILTDGLPHRQETATTLALAKMGETHLVNVHTGFYIPANGAVAGKCVLVMDVHDGTLADYLESIRRGPQQCIAPKQLLSIAVQILKGLMSCHSNQYVHRDLKPENGNIQLEYSLLYYQFYSLEMSFVLPNVTIPSPNRYSCLPTLNSPRSFPALDQSIQVSRTAPTPIAHPNFRKTATLPR